MTNIEKLLAYVNTEIETMTPHGIEFFNLELKLSFDKDAKVWTGQILNDSGIAINAHGIDFDFSSPDMNNVIDKLVETWDADFL